MEQNMFDELVQGIIKVLRGNVVKIVLYGSVARGTQTSESDIDIFSMYLLSFFLLRRTIQNSENDLG